MTDESPVEPKKERANLPSIGGEKSHGDEVNVRGFGSLGAGGDATYNALGKGSNVYDNRTIIVVGNGTSHKPLELTPEDESRDYSDYVRQIGIAYGRLDLEVLMPTTEGEHPKVELREVFVPPLLRADPPRVELPVELHRRLIESGELSEARDGLPEVPGVDRGAWEEARQAYRDRPAVGLLEMLDDAGSNLVVLLGDPGAGKSTVARYLTLVLTAGALSGAPRSLAGVLPVVVELRRYADADWRDKSFEDFLAHTHAQEGHAPSPALLRQRLTSGKALVIFDGLDELFDPKVREDVTKRITGFSGRYPGARILVTSRIIGYARHLLDGAGFKHYMIQSLNGDQIADFASRWYETVCPGDKQGAERLRARLVDAIEGSRPVRELAGNPLLLTILAIIARRQRLPRDRAGVYQHAVNVLIAHWDEDVKHLDLTAEIRPIADLDDRDRREMLERLARQMQTGEGGIAGNHILGEDVEKVFTEYLIETLQLSVAPAKKVARAMVKQFRERNFILSLYGSQVYGFVHRAFLEYLAASDIVRRYERRELTDEDLLGGIFTKRAPDATWHEVLLLIAGQVGERIAGQAIDNILELGRNEDENLRAPFAVLGLRALAEVRKIGLLESQSIKVAKALTGLWEEHHVLPSSANSEISASLNSLGPQWAGRSHIVRWLHSTGGGIRSSAVAYRFISDCVALQAIAGNAVDPAARANAVRELSARWRHEDEVFSFIRDRAISDSHEIVRSDALDELAEHWTEEPGVRELLLDRAVNDPHESVRRWALPALHKNWPNDRAVQNLFMDRCVYDEHEEVRQQAIGEVAEVRSVDTELRDLFRDRVAHDPSSQVRSDALDELAEHWAEDPDVRELVLDRAENDPHEYVRQWALVTLAEQWREDEDVRSFVLERATNDPDKAVMMAGLQAAGRSWYEEKDFRSFLTDFVKSDPRPDVRAVAIVVLAERWGRESQEIRDLVVFQARQDDEPAVRMAAISVGALHRLRGHQSIRDLVRDRAVKDPDARVRIAALYTLSGIWGTAVEREFVEECIASDRDEEVQISGRSAIAIYWPDQDSAGLAARELRERACEDFSDEFMRSLIEAAFSSPQPLVRETAAHLLGVFWCTHETALDALQESARSDPDEKTRRAISEIVKMAEAYALVGDRLY
ncbi:HEAT repeat domain-containing protein [Streptomyces hydrogenans]|uniref:HEAT repeat domain-containing protein n=1 Tax=Streptomyces hydrogenans TaxID=1873719 RepID=UPI0038043A86